MRAGPAANPRGRPRVGNGMEAEPAEYINTDPTSSCQSGEEKPVMDLGGLVLTSVPLMPDKITKLRGFTKAQCPSTPPIPHSPTTRGC
jgi:hypothetical protein